MMEALGVTALTLVSAIGRGLEATEAALRDGRSGLSVCSFDGLSLNTYIGEVPGLDDLRVASELAVYDCRNSRLAQLALRTDRFGDAVRQAVERYGSGRVCVVVGTTSSGIQEAERAYAKRVAETDPLRREFQFEYSQSHFSVTDFTRRYLGLRGPAFAVSTACSSSSKVFVDAQQLLAAEVCDAVVVGGVDSLCWMSLCGFNSLQLLSPRPCRPADANRDGLSIGEAAGFALIERSAVSEGRTIVRLLGAGGSCDAHHMSAPHPEGLGAVLAMEGALAQACIEPADVDYINLHGPARLPMIARGCGDLQVFGTGTPCSSTSWTGHAWSRRNHRGSDIGVGFAGDFCPAPKLETRIRDTLRDSRIAPGPVQCTDEPFGFGGSNCSLILAKP
jgi:3-oxoacyl-[acyl-carrier-protein] synthase-1